MVSYRQSAFAENTKKSYRTHLKCYLDFCERTGLAPLPLSSHNVCRYAAFLAGVKELKPASIPKYLNIIRLLHNEFGFPNPCKENWFLDHILSGIKRVHGNTVIQKLPITPDILKAILSVIDVEAPLYCAFWAACLVMFWGLLRKSNVLVTDKFDPELHLCRRDIILHSWGVLLDISWSKTIQCKEKVLQVALPYMPGHPLCPTSALIRNFKQTNTVHGNYPAICYINHGVVTPLKYHEFLHILKQTLRRCGLKPGDYAGHSFRRGGATFALSQGVPGELIQILGDWKSDAYKLYLSVSVQEKAKHINSLLVNVPY